MGAWGALAFDNDEANDWAYELENVADLSLVESALNEVIDSEDYLDAHLASEGLAACEVIARLIGNLGYQNAYTEKVDLWVKKHPQKPSSALLKKAHQVIDRVLAENSELRKLWAENGDVPWVQSVEELRTRLGT